MIKQIFSVPKVLMTLAICLCVSVFLKPAFVESATSSWTFKEKQIIQTTETLKNVIEENHRLATENEYLYQEIDRLRTSKARSGYTSPSSDSSVSDALTFKQFRSKVPGVFELAAAKPAKVAKADSSKKDAGKKVRKSSGMKGMAKQPMAGTKTTQREAKTLDLLSRIDAFAEDDPRLRSDAAKAHYNMGNIYYHKGEYEIAAREYYQAVVLMPDDPDSHYNLAFVSGEHLRDYRTALKHYKMYLYLNPGAQDRQFVQEKVVHAELALGSEVISPLEEKNQLP